MCTRLRKGARQHLGGIDGGREEFGVGDFLIVVLIHLCQNGFETGSGIAHACAQRLRQLVKRKRAVVIVIDFEEGLLQSRELHFLLIGDRKLMGHLHQHGLL